MEWQGEGAPPPPNSLGIRYFTFVLPDERELARVVERVRGVVLTAEK